jgi:ribosomal protein L7/L12
MPKCRFCDENVPLTATLCPTCGAPIDGLSPQAVEDLEQQVRSLLGQGQKLNAVKLYKERASVSFKEAKDAVDALERAESPKFPAEVDDDTEAELVRLLEGGKKLQAVKLYKQRTGAQLIDSKQAVEALAARHGIAAEVGGCAGVVAAIALLMVVIVALIR